MNKPKGPSRTVPALILGTAIAVSPAFFARNCADTDTTQEDVTRPDSELRDDQDRNPLNELDASSTSVSDISERIASSTADAGAIHEDVTTTDVEYDLTGVLEEIGEFDPDIEADVIRVGEILRNMDGDLYIALYQNSDDMTRLKLLRVSNRYREIRNRNAVDNVADLPALIANGEIQVSEIDPADLGLAFEQATDTAFINTLQDQGFEFNWGHINRMSQNPYITTDQIRSLVDQEPSFKDDFLGHSNIPPEHLEEVFNFIDNLDDSRELEESDWSDLSQLSGNINLSTSQLDVLLNIGIHHSSNTTTGYSLFMTNIARHPNLSGPQQIRLFNNFNTTSSIHNSVIANLIMFNPSVTRELLELAANNAVIEMNRVSARYVLTRL
jgi:hypothetical protein